MMYDGNGWDNREDGSMSDVEWPIWTLELTGSASTSDSYPLEIGVACLTSPDATIVTWQTPISPLSIEGWDVPSDAVLKAVGMDRATLVGGTSPFDLANTLNDVFMTAKVYGRGGTNDVHLANRLNLAAKTWPTYSMCHWKSLNERTTDRADEAWRIIAAATGDAGDRAGGILKAIAAVMGHSPGTRRVPTMSVSLPF